MTDMRRDRREHLDDELDALVAHGAALLRTVCEVLERVHELHDVGDHRVEYAATTVVIRHLYQRRVRQTTHLPLRRRQCDQLLTRPAGNRTPLDMLPNHAPQAPQEARR